MSARRSAMRVTGRGTGEERTQPPAPRSGGGLRGQKVLLAGGSEQPAPDVIDIQHETIVGEGAEDIQGKARLQLGRWALPRDPADHQMAKFQSRRGAAVPVEV